ncbi:hypothetical protein B0T18DRAFT_397143 [Schizothecium vesticola]|uniref:Secreted protein n=1 Tax=Schizothecium vesticola TaxID=314040 RepID=A0AA40F988_9PEZI|nr:hypothetical protein B0T18DRAFT_397143 [Schizothecium vesticola]
MPRLLEPLLIGPCCSTCWALLIAKPVASCYNLYPRWVRLQGSTPRGVLTVGNEGCARSRRDCVPSATGCSTKSLKKVLARL